MLKDGDFKLPREVNWTIGFDGKSLGQGTGRTPKDFAWYSMRGPTANYKQRACADYREALPTSTQWYIDPWWRTHSHTFEIQLYGSRLLVLGN